MLRRLLTCPLCGTRVGIPAAATVGKRAACGACGEIFRIPSRALGAVPPALTLDGGARTAPEARAHRVGVFWQEDEAATRPGPVGTLRMGSVRAPRQADDGPGHPDALDGPRDATRVELDLRSLRARFARTLT